MNRFENTEEQKRKIVEYIEVNGPSLPLKIANYFRIDSIITNALLSELLSDKKLKISHMRVGNSPIYYLRGQEFQLDKFITYLSNREKEAFEILKEKGVVDDSLMSPPVRVALRSIKDFAFPVQYRGKLFWRFLKINDQKAIDILEHRAKISSGVREDKHSFVDKLRQVVMPQKSSVEGHNFLVERGIETNFQKEPSREVGFEVQKKQSEFILQKNIEHPVKEGISQMNEGDKVRQLVTEQKLDIFDSVKKEETIEVGNSNKIENVLENKIIVKKSFDGIKPKKKSVKKKSAFVESVLGLIEKENYDIVENEKVKKKDYSAVIGVGDKKFFCIAKEKKIITENDLMSAMKAGYKVQLPVLFISDGEPNKKASDWLDYLGDLVVFKRLDKD